MIYYIRTKLTYCNMAFICVDIGGTNTLIGLGKGQFKVTKKYKTQKFLENIDKHIQKCIEDCETQEKDIEKVLVAAAGPIDREKGVFRPPNLQKKEMQQINIKEKLQTYGAVKIINDCSSAALGEYEYGNHNTENLVYITISSGIGAGIILDKKLLQGKDGNVGEVGHLKLGNEKLECGCGGQGHWEAHSSGNKMPKMAEKLFEAQFSSSREIFEKYQKGDEKAEKTIQKMQEINQKGIITINNLYNPEKIVIGGAVAINHPETVIDSLKNVESKDRVNEPAEITGCSLGEESVLQGLRAIANEKSSVPEKLRK